MRILCIDCEGPLTLNDNAFEICQHFLPQGDYFFKLISSFDDYLADVIKKEGYTAGGTLKLIVPFLKAYGLDNKKIKEYSKKSLKLVPGAKDMLQELKSLMKVFIISTSYTLYIQAFCESTSFPLDNTFSTHLDLDSFSLSEEEKEKLLKLYKKITDMSLSPPSGKNNITFAEKKTIKKLDKIFFEEITSMSCKALLDEVRPVRGEDKKRAVEKVINNNKIEPGDAAYVGDSITDKEALRFIKKEGGVSISFNGNVYALREAEFACISSHTYPLFLVLKRFKEEGREAVVKIASNWPDTLSGEEKEGLFSLAPGSIFARIREENFPQLLKASKEKRAELRGKKIGELG